MDDFATLLVSMGTMSLIMTIASIMTYRQAITPGVQTTDLVPDVAPFPDIPTVDGPYTFANVMQRTG
jgi:hypothetical protein